MECVKIKQEVHEDTIVDEQELLRKIKEKITLEIWENMQELFERLKNVEKNEAYVRLMLQLLRFSLPQIKSMEIKPFSEDETEDWLLECFGVNERHDSKT